MDGILREEKHLTAKIENLSTDNIVIMRDHPEFVFLSFPNCSDGLNKSWRANI